MDKIDKVSCYVKYDINPENFLDLIWETKKWQKFVDVEIPYYFYISSKGHHLHKSRMIKNTEQELVKQICLALGNEKLTTRGLFNLFNPKKNRMKYKTFFRLLMLFGVSGDLGFEKKGKQWLWYLPKNSKLFSLSQSSSGQNINTKKKLGVNNGKKTK